MPVDIRDVGLNSDNVGREQGQEWPDDTDL